MSGPSKSRHLAALRRRADHLALQVCEIGRSPESRTYVHRELLALNWALDLLEPLIELRRARAGTEPAVTTEVAP